MTFINYASREINCKVTYYGAGLCGKVDNLRFIYRTAKPEAKGRLISLATEDDPTLFFDFLPLGLGNVRGFKTRFHLYTVPGQIFYYASREIRGIGRKLCRLELDEREELLRPAEDVLPRQRLFEGDGFSQKLPDRHLGFKAASRSWKIIWSSRLFLRIAAGGSFRRGFSFVVHFTRGRGGKAKKSSAEGGLPAAALSHETKGFSFSEAEAHAVDRRYVVLSPNDAEAPPAIEVGLEVPHFEEHTAAIRARARAHTHPLASASAWSQHRRRWFGPTFSSSGSFSLHRSSRPGGFTPQRESN